MASNFLWFVVIMIVIILICGIAYVINPDILTYTPEVEEQPPPPPDFEESGSEEEPPTFP